MLASIVYRVDVICRLGLDDGVRMKLLYGSALVREKPSPSHDGQVLYRSRHLRVSSKEPAVELDVDEQGRLFIWGRIYAVHRPEGTYCPVDGDRHKTSVLGEVFSERNLDTVIPRLEGDFVGCLVRHDNEVVVFSDRYNRREVFYSVTGKGVKASTDLELLTTEAGRPYDQGALANMLCIFGGYAPKKHTMYQRIRRLGVGERLIIRPEGHRVERLPFRPAKIGDYGAEELAEYATLLEDAVRVRASRSMNWIYMTGGWDSTAIAALLVRHLGPERVRAVTGRIALSDSSRDTNVFEADRARQMALHFGIDGQEVPWDLTTDHAVACWRDMARFFRKTHVYAKNSVDYFFMSDYLRQRASPGDAVFSGEISDGAHNFGFACSRTIQEHPDLEFRVYADKMAAYLYGPTFLGSVIEGTYARDAVYRMLRSRAAGHLFEDDLCVLNERERKAKFIASCFIRSRRLPFYSNRNHRFLTEEGANLYEAEMFDAYLNECLENLEPDNVYSWIMHLYNSFHWQGSTIRSISETARYNNLGTCLPYWDTRLQHFLSRMPESWGRGLDLRPIKYPLKWMLQNRADLDYPLHLQAGSRSFRDDADPRFSLHAEFVYRSAISPHFKKTLKDYPFEEILDPHYFDLGYCRKLADDYVAGVEVNGSILADLRNLMLLCWVGWY
jgi:hypothetical protein